MIGSRVETLDSPQPSKAFHDEVAAIEAPVSVVAVRSIVAIVTVLSLLAIAGWITREERLTDWLQPYESMRASTAVAVILLAFALLFSLPSPVSFARRWVGISFAVLGAVLGLVKYAGVGAALDELFFKSAFVNPMAASTTRFGALGLTLLGLSIGLCYLRGRRWAIVSHILSLATLLLTMVSILGYFFGATSLFGSQGIIPMSLPTTTCLLLLAIGAWLRLPSVGVMSVLTDRGPGSVIVRRLLPFIIIAPVVLSYTRLWAERAGNIDHNMGTAITVMGTLVFLSGALFVTAKLLNTSEDASLRHLLRFRNLIELAPDPLVIVDQDGVIDHVNLQAERMFGYHRGQLVGQQVDILFPGSGRSSSDTFVQIISAHPEMKPIHGLSLNMLRKDGSEVPVEINIAPLAADDETLYTASIRDMSEHRRMERDIRELNEGLERRVADRTAELEQANQTLSVAVEERKVAEQEALQHREDLRQYVDSMSTMNAKIGLDGRIIMANSAAVYVSGKSGEELVGMDFLDGPWFSYDPAVEARVKEAFDRAVHGEAINYEEKVYSNGRPVPISFSLVPVLDEHGRVEYVVAEGTDITALREAQDALQEKTEQLQVANRELESFTYSVSHDLRAPIRAMVGFSKILEEDYGTALDVEGVRFIRVVRDNATKMGRLVDDLLEFSRLGRKQVAKRRINPKELVEEVFSVIEREVCGRNVELSVTDLPAAMADPGLIRLVLYNLVANAVKFSRDRDPAIIQVGFDKERGAYYVRDNGVGFDMAYSDKLFGVFNRLHKAEDFEGTGVGLANVQRIVQRHGGDVWAYAEEGKGATFYFTLGAPSQ